MNDMTCCPLSGSDGSDRPACFQSKRPRARKEHRCTECGETIAPGHWYEHASGVWDGRPDSFKTCLSCVEIRDHFACDGFVYGNLWSDLQDNFFPDMKAGGPCMAGLSPATKQRLIDERMKWYMENCEPNGAPPPSPAG